jgi:tripartite-type tricarboxylate transporter receptor subunit TctC
VPTFKELGYNAAVELWFLLIAPKGTPSAVVQFIHDNAKRAMGDTTFKNLVKTREIGIDYRGRQELREAVWDQYRKYTDILSRIGLLKG